jgi:hypothetical protein
MGLRRRRDNAGSPGSGGASLYLKEDEEDGELGRGD